MHGVEDDEVQERIEALKMAVKALEEKQYSTEKERTEKHAGISMQGLQRPASWLP